MGSLFLWITREARSSPCQSWVDYTMITAEVLELFRLCYGADGCVRGAHLIEVLAYLRSFVPSCAEKDNNRKGIALPCENPEGNHGKPILMTTLSSHER